MLNLSSLILPVDLWIDHKNQYQTEDQGIEIASLPSCSALVEISNFPNNIDDHVSPVSLFANPHKLSGEQYDH